jgi:hypothetical protein
MPPTLVSTLLDTLQYTKRTAPKITCNNCTSEREYFLCGHDFRLNYVSCPEHNSLEVPLIGKYKTYFRDGVCPQWLCQLDEEKRQKQLAEWNLDEEIRETEENARMLAEEQLPLVGEVK